MVTVRTLFFVSALVSMLVLASCSCEKTTADQARVPRFVIVNVLEKESFDDCHIKGSVNVPFMDLKNYALKHWDKNDTQIVVHCSNYLCGASSEGYTMLTKEGFKHVWAFEGGTAEAKQFGIPVVGACLQGYLQNYEKPEGYKEKETVAIISVDELKKKIEEFALNKES